MRTEGDCSAPGASDATHDFHPSRHSGGKVEGKGSDGGIERMPSRRTSTTVSDFNLAVVGEYSSRRRCPAESSRLNSYVISRMPKRNCFLSDSAGPWVKLNCSVYNSGFP